MAALCNKLFQSRVSGIQFRGDGCASRQRSSFGNANGVGDKYSTGYR